MKTWDQFYDYYLSDLPGCTYFAAANELRHAARDFCSRSHAWRVLADPIVTVEGVSQYEFDSSAEMEVVKLLSAKLDGHDLPLLLFDYSSTAHGIVAIDQANIVLLPQPAPGLALLMKAIVRPSLTAVGVDDVIFSMYGEEIANGAKARLTALMNKAYSNPAKSAEYKAVFDAAIARTRVKVAKSFSNAPLRTTASFM